MNIGYACLTIGVYGTKQRTCIVKNATPDLLRSLISSNLEVLLKILDYNIQNEIKLFRISSEIIPFASHPINTLNWWDEYSEILNQIGQKALSNGIRLSMHAGHYTVLNSPDEDVVARSIGDLQYHARFLDALNLGSEHKIILHIGGIYGDKSSAKERFIRRYRELDENIRQRLIIENDDRQYNISDVISIGEGEGIPVVFDNLHHRVNPDNSRTEAEWITACKNTWRKEDGAQKLHYSQQAEGKRIGSHSATIDVTEFLSFYARLPSLDVDIMAEVKDKNLSAIKCINAIAPPQITRLEKECGRYKYLILEHSHKCYNEIRQLLKDKKEYPVVEFYRLLDGALRTTSTPGSRANAAMHVWGYFKNRVDEKTKASVLKKLDQVSSGGSTTPLKRQLWQLSQLHQETYLEDSLYFCDLF